MESQGTPPRDGTIAVPFEVTSVSPYVFELFAGSLIYMPHAAPAPHSTQFFLPESQPITQSKASIESPATLAGVTAGPHPPGMLSPPVKTAIFRMGELQQKTAKERSAPKKTRAPKPRTSPKIVAPKFRPPAFETRQDPRARRESEMPAKPKRLSLAERLQRWLEGNPSKLDGVRRGTRVSGPGLVAFYWSGGNSKPHEVVDISTSGFYLRTRERWIPNTLVRMTFQRPHLREGNLRQTISILARVVRIDDDGVGHEFVTTEALLRVRTRDVIPDQGTDQKVLEKFLHLH
jgi:hypothetical protein